jgi:hypothetical protein
MTVTGSRRTAGGLLAALLVLVLVGCAGPTITDGGYRAKTAGALKDVSSALATAKLVEQLRQQGRMAFALVDETISEAESDASSAQSSWESRQPPTDAALKLHDQIEQPIQNAVSALEDLRIAERRGDAAATAKALDEVDKSSDEIDKWVQAMSG